MAKWEYQKPPPLMFFYIGWANGEWLVRDKFTHNIVWHSKTDTWIRLLSAQMVAAGLDDAKWNAFVKYHLARLANMGDD